MALCRRPGTKETPPGGTDRGVAAEPTRKFEALPAPDLGPQTRPLGARQAYFSRRREREATRSEISRDAQSVGIELIALVASGASGRAMLDFGILPRSAAHHAAIAVAVDPGRAVGRGHRGVLIVPAVFDPFRDITMHVVKAEPIRRKAPDRHRALPVHLGRA